MASLLPWLFGSGGSNQKSDGTSSSSGSTTGSGTSTTTEGIDLSDDQVLNMVNKVLGANNLGQIFADQNAAGLYGGSNSGLMANSMILDAVMQASIARAKKTSTTNMQQQQQQQQSSQSYQNQDSGGNRGIVGNIVRGIGRLFRSDRSLKTDIKLIGKTSKGYPLYSFKYKDTGEEATGVMHDEVPANARHYINGVWYVDYDKVM